MTEHTCTIQSNRRAALAPILDMIPQATGYAFGSSRDTVNVLIIRDTQETAIADGTLVKRFLSGYGCNVTEGRVYTEGVPPMCPRYRVVITISYQEAQS